MNNWDHRFLALAQHVAGWSKDPGTQCGAVITNGRRIVSVGYNGFAAGVRDHEIRLQDRATKLAMTIHAEENAILEAPRRPEGCTIYVWPLPPCSLCAAKIIQAGIVRVVAPEYKGGNCTDSIALGVEQFAEAMVSVDLCN